MYALVFISASVSYVEDRNNGALKYLIALHLGAQIVAFQCIHSHGRLLVASTFQEACFLFNLVSSSWLNST